MSPLDVQLRTKVYDKTIYPLNREKLRNTVNHAFDKSTETYVIQLNSFNWIEEKLENDYGVFQDKFDQLFKDIKKQKAKNLIIDLRFNMGGNSFIPGLFYSYIALGDFKEGFMFESLILNSLTKNILRRLMEMMSINGK